MINPKQIILILIFFTFRLGRTQELQVFVYCRGYVQNSMKCGVFQNSAQ
jgi:hypothetical protein